MAKALVAAGPVIAFCSVIGTRGLVSWCAETQSQALCTAGYFGYAFVLIVIGRLFYVWLKPKSGERDDDAGM